MLLKYKTTLSRSLPVRSYGKFSSSTVLSPENRQKCIRKFEAMVVQQGTKDVQKKAAVLIPVYVKGDSVSLLYTLRATSLKTHRGQVSFPGGMQDEKDETLKDTALRETEEELGIPASDIEVWGTGNPIQRHDMSVVPVIGCLKQNLPLNQLRFSSHEVEEIFTMKLEQLCNPYFNKHTQFRGTYSMPVYLGGQHRIWGLTALMTFMFLKALLPTEHYNHQVKYIPDIRKLIFRQTL